MEYLKILQSAPLFGQIKEEEIPGILSCLSSRRVSCRKNEFICRPGDLLSSVGLVLAGEVHIIKEDFWGNRTILGKAEPGQLFAESYACAGRPLEVAVTADCDSEILFLDIRNLLNSCSRSCPFHQRLIQNFAGILSRKNLMLTKKIEHMSRRSLRDKLLSYLSDESMSLKFGRDLQDADSYSFDFHRDFAVESYLEHQGRRFVERFDANSYFYITRAMDYFDLAARAGGDLARAFASAKAAFLVVSFSSDWLFPTAESRKIVNALLKNRLNVSFCEIKSAYGHDAFLLEADVLGPMLRDFLRNRLEVIHG